MICKYCNEILRVGVVIDFNNELNYCPTCHRVYIIQIGGEDDTQERLQTRTENGTEEQNRRQDNQPNGSKEQTS